MHRLCPWRRGEEQEDASPTTPALHIAERGPGRDVSRALFQEHLIMTRKSPCDCARALSQRGTRSERATALRHFVAFGQWRPHVLPRDRFSSDERRIARPSRSCRGAWLADGVIRRSTRDWPHWSVVRAPAERDLAKGEIRHSLDWPEFRGIAARLAIGSGHVPPRTVFDGAAEIFTVGDDYVSRSGPKRDPY